MTFPEELTEDANELDFSEEQVQLLIKAYDYGYEDGEMHALDWTTKIKLEFADRLRGMAYDLEQAL